MARQIGLNVSYASCTAMVPRLLFAKHESQHLQHRHPVRARSLAPPIGGRLRRQAALVWTDSPNMLRCTTTATRTLRPPTLSSPATLREPML